MFFPAFPIPLLLSVLLPPHVSCAKISAMVYRFSVKFFCQHGGYGRPVLRFSFDHGTDQSKSKLPEMACVSSLSLKRFLAR